ncbi:hypothetical protein J2Y60_004911 [Arcicella sp. BE140]|nr:hypothetical protein [Arcicella sp. BE51]MDR6814693.1 hypothetical protein [Arcicella sp. BE140]MDR6826144.1 hypothetical protein [Arcicella sp. BE139]
MELNLQKDFSEMSGLFLNNVNNPEEVLYLLVIQTIICHFFE